MSYGYGSNEPWSRGAKIGTWVGVLFVLALLFGLVSCGSMSKYDTGPGEVAVHVTGGIFLPVDEEIKDCVDPSSTGYEGLGEQFIEYPTTQRTVEFSDDDDADFNPIQVVSPNSIDPKTGQSTGTVEMTVSGIATFTLNTQCDVLKEFQRDIGGKLHADTEGGWDRLLATYFRTNLEKALDTASKQYEFNGLYGNPQIKEKWEDQTGALFSQYLASMAGGPYFCGPEFDRETSTECGDPVLTVQSPEISDELAASIERQQIATQDNLAAQKENATKRTEAQGFALAVKDCKCSPAEYNQWLAIREGIAILPGGVLVDTGAGSTSSSQQ